MTDTQSYKAAYATLRHNAERLEQNDDICIDDLLSIVDDSIQAYKICQARITAVEQALAQSFETLD